MTNITIDDIDSINPKFKGLIALNQKQTAEIIGVSQSTMENWRRDGIGIAYKKVDSGKKGRILYLKKDILNWLSSRVITA